MYDRIALMDYHLRRRALAIVFAMTCCAGPSMAAGSGSIEPLRIDIGLVVFDPGIPVDQSSHSRLGIFPEIRKAEAQYMPVILRQVLIESRGWGVVRVLPEVLDSSELLVTGTIVYSDGLRLQLRINARDAGGVEWLNRVYSGSARPADYLVSVPQDPYLALYREIADDLVAVHRQKSAKQLASIRDIALMRYAIQLAPAVFTTYLTRAADGHYTLARFPAEGDPMLARVIRIRNQEYLFIDTVDEQYQRLSEEMASTYNLWRQYGAEQAIYQSEYQQRVASRGTQGRRGSFTALERSYNTYKWSKIHEQDLVELALGFNNEVAPTVMDVSGTVFELSGTLDAQYSEWREILQRIFTLETGLVPAS
ncbi:MAG: hypothetical protein P8J79_06275 [Halioglobus sp.]|nr:hypothetical protein [Halioglobus sp.]